MQQVTLLVGLAPAQGLPSSGAGGLKLHPLGRGFPCSIPCSLGKRLMDSSSSCSSSLPSCSLDVGGRGLSEQLDLVLSQGP